MLKKLAKLPVRIAQFIAATVMGRNTAPDAEPPPPPPPRRKPAPPRPAAKAEADHGHDHGHDHGGAPKAEPDHGHDHGHDHGGAPKAEPDHGHDHGHDHGGAPAEAPAKPAIKAPAKAAAPAPAEPAAEPAAEPEAKKAKVAKKAVDVSPEDTPNPNARKFACSVRVVEKGSLSFASAEEAEKHPLGKALFAVGGVKSVFAVNDFVTVTKTDDGDWAKLTPKLVKAIKASV